MLVPVHDEARDRMSQPASVAAAIDRLHPDGLPAVARAMAEQLRRQTRWSGPPFDPRAACREEGIQIVERPIQARAQLVRGDSCHGKPIILTNRPGQGRDSRQRQTFAIAHELGHYTLRRDIFSRWRCVRFTQDDPVEETFCDAFAAELLMPARLFSVDLCHAEWLPSRFPRLAARYGVPLRAALRRAVELTGHAVDAIMWRGYGRTWHAQWATNRRFRHAILCTDSRRWVNGLPSLSYEAFRDSDYAGLVPRNERSTEIEILLEGIREPWLVAGIRIVNRRQEWLVTLVTQPDCAPFEWRLPPPPERVCESTAGVAAGA